MGPLLELVLGLVLPLKLVPVLEFELKLGLESEISVITTICLGLGFAYKYMSQRWQLIHRIARQAVWYNAQGHMHQCALY